MTENQPLRFYPQLEQFRSGNDHEVRGPSRHFLSRLAVLICTGCAVVPCSATTQSASINASVSKPLVVTKLQDLDLGTVTLGPGVWSNATVSLSRAGVFSCSNANVICTGVTNVTKYNVQGSNNQTVRISAPNVTMINQSDATKTLTLITDAPASVLLTSSGHPGVDFSIGGSVALSSTTAAGTYVGTFNVTVDY